MRLTNTDPERIARIINGHIHNREEWFGKLAVQTATDWGEAESYAPYRAISGAGVYGADPNDEALVLGTAVQSYGCK